MRISDWSSDVCSSDLFALSGPAEYKVFTLSNPDRLVVDLQDSRLASSYREAPPTGPVTSVRTGSPMPGALRVVFDLVSAVRPKPFLLLPSSGQGNRLVTELHSQVAASVAKTVLELEIGRAQS